MISPEPSTRALAPDKPSEATDRTASTPPVGGTAAAAAAERVVVAFFGEKAMMRNSTQQQDRQQCPELPTAAGPQHSTGSYTNPSSSRWNTCDSSAARKIPSSCRVVLTWEEPSSSDVTHSRPVSASERGSGNSQQVAVAAAAAGARPGGDHCHDDDDDARAAEESTHEAQSSSETRTPAQGQASFYPIDFLLKCTHSRCPTVSSILHPAINKRAGSDRPKKKVMFFAAFAPPLMVQ